MPRRTRLANRSCDAEAREGAWRRLAEGEGFEPPVPFRVQWFSRPPPSTTRPSLRVSGYGHCDSIYDSRPSSGLGARSSGARARELGSSETEIPQSMLQSLELEAGGWELRAGSWKLAARKLIRNSGGGRRRGADDAPQARRPSPESSATVLTQSSYQLPGPTTGRNFSPTAAKDTTKADCFPSLMTDGGETKDD